MDTATLFSQAGLPNFPISDQLCLHQSLPVLNSTLKGLSARNQTLATEKISYPVHPEPYDILQWNKSMHQWESLPFAGFGQLTAKAWAVFQTNGTAAPTLLKGFNVIDVILRPERPAGDFSQFNVLYNEPLTQYESTMIASGSIPNSQGKDVGIPEVDTKGDPDLFYAPGGSPGTQTMSPENFYKSTTNPYGIPPVEFRNHCTVLWRPNGLDMPPAGSILSVIVFARITGEAGLYEDPSLKALGMSYKDLAIGEDVKLF